MLESHPMWKQRYEREAARAELQRPWTQPDSIGGLGQDDRSTHERPSGSDEEKPRETWREVPVEVRGKHWLSVIVMTVVR